MTKIGVDSSGHVKNPPIWFVASRRSKNRGQLAHAVYVSNEKHSELAQCTKDWYEKVCAILIYKVVRPIFYQGDVLVIDVDFQASAKYIEKYLRKLLQFDFPRNPYMANPAVFFIPETKSNEVKDAHIKSQRLHSKELPYCRREKDPSFKRELAILD